MFQSTHPHGVRPGSRHTKMTTILFQSTHPHGVRLSNHFYAIWQIFVSIHAPTRGATSFRVHGMICSPRFQSTHPHGVRLRPRRFGRSGTCFNPRTHTGCDNENVIPYKGLEVSIHAPTRGATCGEGHMSKVLEVSIHAPTRGATLARIKYPFANLTFQSTHPHGVRPTGALRI